VRSVSTGSIRAARHAGSQHAAAPTVTSTVATTTSVAGSVDVTPCNKPLSRRVSASAPMSPASTPADVHASPCLSTNCAIDRGAPPMASRMPISRRRSVTVNAMAAYTPAAASASAARAKMPRPIIAKRVRATASDT
jgi:hypothetical protein